MKITIPKIKKNFKKKKSEINPNIYWNYILYITFGMIVLSFAFGFYMFTKTNTEAASTLNEQTGQIGTVKKVRIDNVLKYFFDRKEKSIKIQNSPSPVVDPSL